MAKNLIIQSAVGLLYNCLDPVTVSIMFSSTVGTNKEENGKHVAL